MTNYTDFFFLIFTLSNTDFTQNFDFKLEFFFLAIQKKESLLFILKHNKENIFLE